MLVGGGPVAAAKLEQLLAARADVRVVAPAVGQAIEQTGVTIARRTFRADDLEGAWLVVAAATPDVNRAVALAAESRHVFVNAVDDPANATAFLSGVVRRDGVTVAISTEGAAPGLTALLREAIDAVLPRDLMRWVAESARQRAVWKAHGIAMERRRPLLLEALNALYGRKGVVPAAPEETNAEAGSSRCGRVSLVGAGPGDPGLLTRTAVARLRAADLVLYDALVDQRVLRYARRAQRFFVGKRAGRHALTQDAIHSLMIRAVRRGRYVVRLKGGDPFVFGRGGEEVLALATAGVPVDVVPGVTSAVAAPALAGIPVTHRGAASSFLVVSGHDAAVFAAAVESVVPNGPTTVVVLMGTAQAADLAGVLLRRGWHEATAAAVIVDGSLPRQQAWRGTLKDLADNPTPVVADGPGVIVIGAVVAAVPDATSASARADVQARLERLDCAGGPGRVGR